MRNWWVGRHNEVYRIANAHNWPCLVKFDKCAWALECEVFWACLKTVGAMMPMCFCYKAMIIQLARWFKKLKWFITEYVLQWKVKDLCSLCLVSTTFGNFNEDFLKSPGSEKAFLYSHGKGSVPAWAKRMLLPKWQCENTAELLNGDTNTGKM